MKTATRFRSEFESTEALRQYADELVDKAIANEPTRLKVAEVLVGMADVYGGMSSITFESWLALFAEAFERREDVFWEKEGWEPKHFVCEESSGQKLLQLA